MPFLTSQLPLQIGFKDEATFANFYLGRNQQLVDSLQQAVRGSATDVIYLYGAAGVGCSHLLQACCNAAPLAAKRAVYLPLRDIQINPAIFENLELLQMVCVDDIQLLANHRQSEEAFFHCYNRIRDTGGQLIIAANGPPPALKLVLPDMISRLASALVFHLQSLTDKEKLAVLIMRAQQRGMTLTPEVGQFILNHCPRSMSILCAALDSLDKQSLAAQRKLTIPFVKKVLQLGAGAALSTSI